MVRTVAAAVPGLVALVVAVVALTDDPAPAPAAAAVAPAAAPSLTALYDRVSGAVARVDAFRDPDDPPFGNGRRDAIGAGFAIDGDGHVVTNAHVVQGAERATVRFGTSARRVRAEIVGRDDATDLAVLRVDPDDVPGRPLAIAAPGSIEVGEAVLAVGTPYRLQSSASAGIVSAVGRSIEGLTGFTVPDAVQTDAAINPGNSGGPLVDAEGDVIGVNSQGRGPGVGFAVSATTMRRVVPQLIADGRAVAPYLGVAAGDVTATGTRLASVTDGSPADDAGLREGDVVTRIGDRATRTDGALASAVAAGRPGRTVPVVRLRGDDRQTVQVTLGRQPGRR